MTNLPARRSIGPVIDAARSVTVGALYSALERLERKGFLRAELGDPTPQRGGRAQIAAALILATGGGLVGSEYLKLRFLDIGYEQASAGFALLLSAMGVYGSVAYAVARRTPRSSSPRALHRHAPAGSTRGGHRSGRRAPRRVGRPAGRVM
jgi:hypothetical protein